MSTIDYTAYETSGKVFIVAFIVLITLCNFILVFRVLKAGNVFKSVSQYTVLFLSIGDVLLALFPLVIDARVRFEETSFERSCRVSQVAIIYQYFYFQFVYGLTLFFLCLEHSQRLSLRFSSFPVSVVSVMFCAVPWVTGLVAVLPLAWVGLDWDTCIYSENFTLDRARALDGVSSILPCGLVFIGLFLINSLSRSPVSGPENPVISRDNTGTVVAQPQPTAPPVPPESICGVQNSDSPPAYSDLFPRQESLTDCMAIALHAMGNQPQHPGSQTLPSGTAYQHPAMAFPDTDHPSQTNQQNAFLPSLPQTPPYKPDVEKRTLCVLCVAYIAFVLPSAVYRMAILMSDDPPKMDIVLDFVLRGFFEWWRLLRALVLPIVWKNPWRLSRNL